MKEFGCIECPQSVQRKSRLAVPEDQSDPIRCPYCANQTLIPAGDELQAIEDDCL